MLRPQPKGLERPLGFAIRLIPTIAPGTFPLPKLAPDRNCLRATNGSAAALDEQSKQELAPTPLYNTALLQVCCLIQDNFHFDEQKLTPTLLHNADLGQVCCHSKTDLILFCSSALTSFVPPLACLSAIT